MVVLAWVAQLVLFFLFWRGLYFLTVRTRKSQISLFGEMLLNLTVAVVVLIVVHALHSPWWTMIVMGAATGVLTGHAAARHHSE